MIHFHYIILAHKDPALLLRLIENLNDNNATFYVHVDRKADIRPFVSELSKARAQIKWVTPRFNIKWGHLNIVKSTVRAMMAIQLREDTDRIVLLSGQDFPIKTKRYINEYFNLNINIDFIEGEAFPVKTWGEKSWDRITNYHVFTNKRGWVYSLPQLLSFRDWRDLPDSKKKWAVLYFWRVLKKRRMPDYVKPFGGSQWFSVTGYTLKYILKFVHDHPDYIEFHKDTLIPDEIFFHSIIYSSDDSLIAANIVNSNHHYIDWSVRENNYPPAILDNDDFDNLANSVKLFCRKVDSTKSNTLLKRIEDKLLWERR
jgi:hypothetical protein